MTNYKFQVNNSNLKDLKKNREFAEEMNFDFDNKGRKSDRDISNVKLRKSPVIMASGFSTMSLPSDPNE